MVEAPGRGGDAVAPAARLRVARPEDAAAVTDVLTRAFAPLRASYTGAAWALTVGSPERALERMREGCTWVVEADASSRGDRAGGTGPAPGGDPAPGTASAPGRDRTAGTVSSAAGDRAAGRSPAPGRDQAAGTASAPDLHRTAGTASAHRPPGGPPPHRLVATLSAVRTERGLLLRGLGVLPEARGRGHGRRLLSAAEALARQEALGRLVLSTTPFLHAALGLYERFGFRPTDAGPHDLEGTPLLTMEMDLADAGSGPVGSGWAAARAAGSGRPARTDRG